jgi:hypothetical protein
MRMIKRFCVFLLMHYNTCMSRGAFYGRDGARRKAFLIKKLFFGFFTIQVRRMSRRMSIIRSGWKHPVQGMRNKS